MFVCGLKAQWLIHIQLCNQRAVLHLTWLYCGVNRVRFDNFCLLTDCLVIIHNSLIKNHMSIVYVSTLKCNCSFTWTTVVNVRSSRHKVSAKPVSKHCSVFSLSLYINLCNVAFYKKHFNPELKVIASLDCLRYINISIWQQRLWFLQLEINAQLTERSTWFSSCAEPFESPDKCQAEP